MFCPLLLADGSKLHISMDHVPALKLLFWPLQAQAWINRTRKYPSRDIIQSIVDGGCQLVPRSSPGGDSNSECRLSFSNPEAILARLRNKDQQRTYFFIKMLFYRYWKSLIIFRMIFRMMYRIYMFIQYAYR